MYAFLIKTEMFKMDQLIKNVDSQPAMVPTEAGKLELAKKPLLKPRIFKLKNHGYQLLLNLQVHFQFALEPTVLMELTALELFAMEPMDQWTDHPVPHAPERSQLPSHTTTPSQPPDSHTKTLETLPQLTHLLLTHQPQSPLLSSKLSQSKVPTKKPPPPSDPDSTTRDTQPQRRFSSLTQRLPRPTLPSTVNTEKSKLKFF